MSDLQRLLENRELVERRRGSQRAFPSRTPDRLGRLSQCSGQYGETLIKIGHGENPEAKAEHPRLIAEPGAGGDSCPLRAMRS
jgi:hypothetical protein